jgi:protein-tyrosine phosphatase
MTLRVLVVCVGNVCRSPIAQALLREQLCDASIDSAGIDAPVGQPADPTAVALMRERGFDIDGHRACQLMPSQCRQADLILVMDHAQKRYLERRYAFLLGRVFRLGELRSAPGTSHIGFDIPDPYRLTRAAFEQSLQLIECGVEGWSARIRAMEATSRTFTSGTSGQYAALSQPILR